MERRGLPEHLVRHRIGLPQSLLSYCKAGPSSSTSPATAACTSEAILAALPGGATMQKFTCADVSGKLAAARVSPRHCLL